MSSRFWLIWPIAVVACVQAAFAQAGGNADMRPAVPASMAQPPPPPVRITGKVVLEDKSAPPGPALVERICGGLAHPEGTTDAKGNIAIDLGHDIIQDPYAIHVQPGIDLAAAEESHPFMDCAIKVSLPGYRADMVSMATAKPVGHPYLGTIVLHYVGKANGYLVSPVSLEASKDAKKAFDKAQDSTRKNRQAEAIQEYQKAIQLYPEYSAAWVELGRLQAAAHKIDDAKKSFNEAIKADPKFLTPYLQLEVLAEASENWTELADITGKLLELDSVDYPEAYFYNSLSNFRTNKLEPAEKSAREALKVDTQHQFPATYQLLASILVSRNQVPAAIEQLETYLKLYPRADDVVTVQANVTRLKASLPAKR